MSWLNALVGLGINLLSAAIVEAVRYMWDKLLERAIGWGIPALIGGILVAAAFLTWDSCSSKESIGAKAAGSPTAAATPAPPATTTPAGPPAVGVRDLEERTNFRMLDNFDDERSTESGDFVNWPYQSKQLEATNTGHVAGAVIKPKALQSNFARIAYRIPPPKDGIPSDGGWGIRLHESAPAGRGFDVTFGNFNPSHLVFWVRGAHGGEKFRIYMHDALDIEARTSKDISAYTAGGLGVTTSWQNVSIPMDQFPGIDRKRIMEIGFVFLPDQLGSSQIENAGSIDIDIIGVERKKPE